MKVSEKIQKLEDSLTEKEELGSAPEEVEAMKNLLGELKKGYDELGKDKEEWRKEKKDTEPKTEPAKETKEETLTTQQVQQAIEAAFAERDKTQKQKSELEDRVQTIEKLYPSVKGQGRAIQALLSQKGDSEMEDDEFLSKEMNYNLGKKSRGVGGNTEGTEKSKALKMPTKEQMGDPNYWSNLSPDELHEIMVKSHEKNPMQSKDMFTTLEKMTDENETIFEVPNVEPEGNK